MDTVSLDVSSDMTIADLKALVAQELFHTGRNSQPPSPSQLTIYHNGRKLGDINKTLAESGVLPQDMIVAHAPSPSLASAGGFRRGAPSVRTPGSAMQAGRVGDGGLAGPQTQRGLMEPDAEMIRLQVLGDSRLIEELRQMNPELADAVNDPVRFRHAFESLERQKKEAEAAKQREITRINEDPFNPESQARIAELIRQEQVIENLQHALEHNPEAFGKVIMLYIPVEVNGHPIKAFVDSGAQATIMSPGCAEACNIMRLIDSRYAGIARGVGTANILGRVHSAQMKIGGLFLPCSFTVMEGKDVDLLLGLDMLKRHQAKIDLERNCLIIGTSEVPFLGEADIPKANWEVEPTVEGPGGTSIGSRTGALVGPSSGDEALGGTMPTPPLNATPGAYSHTLPSPQPPPTQQRSLISQPQAPPLPPRGNLSDEDISVLTNLGFSRQQAIAALYAAGGNVDLAASFLFPEGS